MHSLLLLAASSALYTLSAAQSSATLFVPYVDSSASLVASQITSDSTATTYYVGCPTALPAESCGIPYPFTLTQGPSTVEYVFSVPDSATYSIECALQGFTSASCVGSIGGPDIPSTEGGVSTEATQDPDLSSLFVPVQLVTDVHAIATYDFRTMTDGYYSVDGSATTSSGASAGSAVTTTGAARTTGSSSPASTTSSSGGGSSSSGSASGSGGSAATANASKTSTGGMPQVTGNAGWVVGGMAAAVAIAAW